MAESSNQSPGLEPTGKNSELGICLNCSAVLRGDYCADCGQQNTTVIRFFPTILLEAFEGLFAFNSKTYRSLGFLLTRPAFLTKEFLAGRRVRYLAPMRLFIVFLLAFLFTISVQIFLNTLVIDMGQESGQLEAPDREQLETEFTAAIDELANELGVDNEERTDTLTPDTNLSEFQAGVSRVLANVQVPFLSEQNNRRFVTLLQERASDNIEAISEDPGDFFNGLLENIPALLLLMMPVLALLQKLFYLGSGKYYVEHLILTIHNHSFLLMCFILAFLLDLIIRTEFGVLPAIAGFLRSLLNLWAVAYLYLSLRLFFGQGYFVTAVKFFTISISYGALLITGALVFMLIGFFIY